MPTFSPRATKTHEKFYKCRKMNEQIRDSLKVRSGQSIVRGLKHYKYRVDD